MADRPALSDGHHDRRWGELPIASATATRDNATCMPDHLQDQLHMAITPASPREAAVAAMAVAALILEAAFLGGCGDPQASTAAAASGGSIAADARQHAKIYPFLQQRQLIKDMSTELAAIRRDIDHLPARSGASHVGELGEPLPSTESLRSQSDSLYHRLVTARTATAQEWPDLTATFQDDLGRLKAGLERSRQKFSAPATP